MINGITPELSAILKKSDSTPEEKRLSDPLSFLLSAALYQNVNNDTANMISEILPYISNKDRGILSEMANIQEYTKAFEECKGCKKESKKGCLSPTGNLSQLICILKRYASLEGKAFFSQLERAMDTARIVGALSENPDPAELFRFMGMGDAANMMKMMPQIMKMFSQNAFLQKC